MVTEHYLEYLALDSILQGYISAGELTKGRPQYCDMWFADDTSEKLDLTKIKKRTTELQKDFLKDYLCNDKTLKKD